MSRMPIATPAPVEPQLSLLRASRPLDVGTGDRWTNGVSFKPWGNVLPGVRDVCDTTTPQNPGVAATCRVDWQPVLYTVSEKESAFGWAPEDTRDRMSAAMKVGKHKAAELEFWSGAQAQAGGYSNLWLTKPGLATDVTPGTVPSIKRAFGLLEQALADCGLGGLGVIHARVEAAPDLTGVSREGNLLKTVRGNLVVPGTGYPNTTGNGGAANAAGTTTIFATSMTYAAWDENALRVLPAGDDAESLGQVLDRSDNTVRSYGSMPGLVAWDGTCTFFCRANLPA